MASSSPSVIVIGAGPSGIALAHEMKHKLGFEDFLIYDKLDGPGGTWRMNTYPGCGCDVPTHLYSFSFNLNPNWSKELCDQPEILAYMESTTDKFDLRAHMIFETECLGAEWVEKESQWKLNFRDTRTDVEYTRYASVFISAVGGISAPRDIRFKGIEKFKGEMFHTARWNHKYDYSGKRMAVIGNGCSAAQIVPSVVDKAGYVKQFARSPQWYHERPNRHFSAFEKWCFRWLPLLQRLHRLNLFMENDNLVTTYMPGENATRKRLGVEANAKRYIYSQTPEKYHSFIVPDFPLGCKRRIFDPGYLISLHSENLTVVPEGPAEITETGIIGQNGEHEEFDLIVLATGFQVSQFLTPVEVKGINGISLRQQWKENRGAQAYMGATVHNFPNFGIVFGPNTFPAHNSALFSCEVGISYLSRVLIKPIIDRRAKKIEVKSSTEFTWVNRIQQSLKGSVYSAGCSNWYINEFGRNAASWPGYASMFWLESFLAGTEAYEMSGGRRTWMWYTLKRWMKTTSSMTLFNMLSLVIAARFLLQKKPALSIIRDLWMRGSTFLKL